MPPDPPADQPAVSRLEARRVARARVRQRQRRGAVVGLLVTTIVLAGAAFARGVGGGTEPPEGAGQSEVTPGPGPTATATPEPVEATWPEEGSGDRRYAAGSEAVLGEEGEVLRYRVAVEDDLELPADDFAAAVAAILADPRGWTAAEHRFQPVAEDDETDFTVFLATPSTSEEICADAGRHTDGFDSCHVDGEVVINVARWSTGVPDYGAPLAEYQAFAINHELGHELGEEHQGCPGTGRPAPVMLPQNHGRDGCTPNGWPFLDGSRYEGPEIP